MIACSGADMSWITVGGIRSTGVSAAAGIAHHVAGLLHGILGSSIIQYPPRVEDSEDGTVSRRRGEHPALVGVSDAARHPLPLDPPTAHCWLTTVPSLATLAREFTARGDGKVRIVRVLLYQ